MPSDETLIILGASGDLAERFLLPGLAELLTADTGRRLKLVGSSRTDHDEWAKVVADAFAGHSGTAVRHCLDTTRWVTADVAEPADWHRLIDAVEGRASLYFALGPDVTWDACHALREVELPSNTRLIMEKPFGKDAESAARLNELLDGLVGAANVFRVDHFLATPVALALPQLRFANPLVETVWSNDHVTELTVVWDEDLGLADRAEFYDETGALRDMVQSHLLLLLAQAIMPRSEGDADQSDALQQALDSLQVATGPGAVRRARWTAGKLAGEQVQAYVDHTGVDASRGTETLVEIEFRSTLDPWRGVPLVLRSGKALGQVRRHLEICFGEPNRLRMQLLTGDAEVSLVAADPDSPKALVPFRLQGQFHRPQQATAGASNAEIIDAAETAPYTRVLQAALSGDSSLSVPPGAAVRCWELIEPIIAQFAADDVPLTEYAAGSLGPDDWPLNAEEVGNG